MIVGRIQQLTDRKWGERNRCKNNEWGAGKWVRWYPNQWAYTKMMMPYKNKSTALMTKTNGNTHTTINIPPNVCSVAEEK